MKLRETIKKWLDCRDEAVFPWKSDVWRAISVLERRTRHLKVPRKVPPFTTPVDYDLTDPSPEEYLVIPANTADFIYKTDLKNTLREMYDELYKTLEASHRVALLDAIDVVTIVLDADCFGRLRKFVQSGCDRCCNDRTGRRE